MLDKANATAGENGQVEYVIPPQTFKIENPVAVVNTSDDLAGAKSFVDFLFTPEAQLIWRNKDSGRSIPPSSSDPGTLPRRHRQAVDDLRARQGARRGHRRGERRQGSEGWKAVDEALFGKKGAITKIYDSGGGKQ